MDDDNILAGFDINPDYEEPQYTPQQIATPQNTQEHNNIVHYYTKPLPVNNAQQVHVSSMVHMAMNPQPSSLISNISNSDMFIRQAATSGMFYTEAANITHTPSNYGYVPQASTQEPGYNPEPQAPIQANSSNPNKDNTNTNESELIKVLTFEDLIDEPQTQPKTKPKTESRTQQRNNRPMTAEDEAKMIRKTEDEVIKGIQGIIDLTTKEGAQNFDVKVPIPMSETPSGEEFDRILRSIKSEPGEENIPHEDENIEVVDFLQALNLQVPNCERMPECENSNAPVNLAHDEDNMEEEEHADYNDLLQLLGGVENECDDTEADLGEENRKDLDANEEKEESENERVAEEDSGTKEPEDSDSDVGYTSAAEEDSAKKEHEDSDSDVGYTSAAEDGNLLPDPNTIEQESDSDGGHKRAANEVADAADAADSPAKKQKRE